MLENLTYRIAHRLPRWSDFRLDGLSHLGLKRHLPAIRYCQSPPHQRCLVGPALPLLPAVSIAAGLVKSFGADDSGAGMLMALFYAMGIPICAVTYYNRMIGR